MTFCRRPTGQGLGRQVDNITFRVFLFGILALCHSPLRAYDFSDDSYLAPSHIFPAWFNVIERGISEQQLIAQCVQEKSICPNHLRGLRVVISRGQELSRKKQIQLTNRWVNQHQRYRSDRPRTSFFSTNPKRIRQEWSTLIDFLQKGGDCEDYATSKYLMLRQFGIQPEDLRIVIVLDRGKREHHALVVVRQGDSITFLDIDNRIYKKLPSIYRSVYSINENAIWDHDQPSKV